MGKYLFIIFILSIFVLQGCGTKLSKIKTEEIQNDAWLLYTNETQGYAIPHLDSWHIKEFIIPIGLPFAMTGFDPNEIDHDEPAQTNNGKIVMQVYNGPYMSRLIEKQKNLHGFTSEARTFGNVNGIYITVDGPNSGKQYLTVVEKKGKTYIFASEELTEPEHIKTYNKMIEGLSLD